MASANLRWTADTGEAEAQILALKAVIDSLGGSTTKRHLNSVSSDLQRVGKDGDKAAKLLGKGFRDVSRTVEDFGKGLSGPFGILKPFGMLINLGGKLGGVIGDVGTALGGMAKEGEQAGSFLASFGSTMGPLLVAIGPLVAGLVALGAALLVLPALAGAAAFVLTALLDVIATGAAVLAAFAGPLVVVTGLLGGLGAAFAFVAKQSFANKMSMQDQHDALLKLHVAQQTYNEDLGKYGKGATQTEKALLALHKAQDDYATAQQGAAVGAANLDDKFHKLVATLSRDFTPEIVKLAGAASTALTYLNNIASLPLDKAFQSLATKGVHLLDKFVRGIGSAISEPIRLAIKVAFGTNTMRNALQGWWDSVRRFLFGFSTKKPIRLVGEHGQRGALIDFQSVPHAGALAPLMTWLGNQHFTSTGLKWATSIINGVTHSGAWANLKKFVESVAQSAGDKAGAAFAAAFEAQAKQIIPNVAAYIASLGSQGNPPYGGGVTGAHGLPTTATTPGASGNTGEGGRGSAHGATGAIVTRPTMSLIGESGPEAVIPLNKMPGAYPLGTRSLVGGSYSSRRNSMVVSFTDAEASRLQRATSRRSVRRG